MPSLSEVSLDVSDPEKSLGFYIQKLGMRLIGEQVIPGTKTTVYSVSFASGACLKLRHDRSRSNSARDYQPLESDAYWKIGVTIADVDVARERLTSRGVQVTEPEQFFDIGYLCHVEDPDGYCIELLQHKFEQNHRPQPSLKTEILGNVPNLGQVSLNVSSIEDSLAFYRDELGLKLLSRQEVPGREFTLWFLGRDDLTPPSSLVDAVENREWLWSLPETTLELRAHHSSQSTRRAHPPDDELGFRGVGFNQSELASCELQDPDGVNVRIT